MAFLKQLRESPKPVRSFLKQSRDINTEAFVKEFEKEKLAGIYGFFWLGTKNDTPHERLCIRIRGKSDWPNYRGSLQDHFIRISRSVIVNRRHIASATKLFGKRYEISVRDTKGSTVETGSRYVENFLGIL